MAEQPQAGQAVSPETAVKIVEAIRVLIPLDYELEDPWTAEAANIAVIHTLVHRDARLAIAMTAARKDGGHGAG